MGIHTAPNNSFKQGREERCIYTQDYLVNAVCRSRLIRCYASETKLFL